MFSNPFSTVFDDTHTAVNRFYQFPLFSYNVAGMPIYYYLMIGIMIFVIIIITIVEKARMLGSSSSDESEPASSEPEQESEEELKNLGGKWGFGGKKRKQKGKSPKRAKGKK
jgi:hypothetical protein